MTTIDENPNKVNWDLCWHVWGIGSTMDATTNLVRLCHGSAIEAGLFTDLETGKPRKVPAERFLELIALELEEAIDALSTGEMDKHLPRRLGVEVEIADMLILIFNMCGHLGLDIGGAIADKVAFNGLREDHKPDARRAIGGKKC